MTPAINVRHSFRKWEAVLASYKREILPAAVSALNRTQTSARAEGSRMLAKEYPGIKISSLKSRMKLTRASRGKPVASIEASGRRIALYGNFRMRSFGRWGVRFGKLPWRIETIAGEIVTPEMLARAFRQRGHGGRASVFSRLTKERESLTVLVAPGIARAWNERGVRDAVRKIWRERFDVEFDRLMRVKISRR